MDTAQGQATHSLELRRSIRASKARLYRAWTEAEELSRWFAPSTDFTVLVHDFDPTVGGRYRIEMRHNDGSQHIVVGVYRELAPPDRVAFTWRWEGNPDAPETLVQVDLHERGEETEVVLRHDLFANVDMRNEHNKGWLGCLNRLADHVA